MRSLLSTGILFLAPLVLLACAPKSPAGKSGAQFAKMDANSDGKVSPEEHAAGAKQMFDMMDGDRNGKVTAVEMDDAHERVTGAKATPSDMPAAEKIKAVDTDGDGLLSAAEHVAGSTSMFGRMDTDKGGFLTEAELAAGHARLMK